MAKLETCCHDKQDGHPFGGELAGWRRLGLVWIPGQTPGPFLVEDTAGVLSRGGLPFSVAQSHACDRLTLFPH